MVTVKKVKRRVKKAVRQSAERVEKILQKTPRGIRSFTPKTSFQRFVKEQFPGALSRPQLPRVDVLGIHRNQQERALTPERTPLPKKSLLTGEVL